jgi:hypothetical protein
VRPDLVVLLLLTFTYGLRPVNTKADANACRGTTKMKAPQTRLSVGRPSETALLLESCCFKRFWSHSHRQLGGRLNVADTNHAGRLIESSIHRYLLTLKLLRLCLVIQLISHFVRFEDILSPRLDDGPSEVLALRICGSIWGWRVLGLRFVGGRGRRMILLRIRRGRQCRS